MVKSQKNIFGIQKLHEIQMSVFINKALLEHRHIYFLFHGCFCASKAELSSWHRDGIAPKAQNIYYLALYGKGFPISVFETLFCWVYNSRNLKDINSFQIE